MPISKSELEARIKKLREAYASKLPDKLARIGEGISELERLWDGERALEVGRLAHNLAGTGESFGFARLGTTARNLEHHLLAIESGERAVAEIGAARALLNRLVAEARASGVDGI